MVFVPLNLVYPHRGRLHISHGTSKGSYSFFVLCFGRELYTLILFVFIFALQQNHLRLDLLYSGFFTNAVYCCWHFKEADWCWQLEEECGFFTERFSQWAQYVCQLTTNRAEESHVYPQNAMQTWMHSRLKDWHYTSLTVIDCITSTLTVTPQN